MKTARAKKKRPSPPTKVSKLTQKKRHRRHRLSHEILKNWGCHELPNCGLSLDLARNTQKSVLTIKIASRFLRTQYRVLPTHHSLLPLHRHLHLPCPCPFLLHTPTPSQPNEAGLQATRTRPSPAKHKTGQGISRLVLKLQCTLYV